MRKIKMLWSLVQPMLAAAGITKPSDLTKLTKPIAKLLDDLREIERQENAELAKISDAIEKLTQRETEGYEAANKVTSLRERLEALVK